jgi:hypothetical protein
MRAARSFEPAAGIESREIHRATGLLCPLIEA